MKKTVSIVLLTLSLTFFLSCEKQRLPEGKYEAIFNVQCGNLILEPCYGPFEVSESNDDYLIFSGGDTLYRNVNEVTGTLHLHGANMCTGHNTWYADYSVSGTIQKEKGNFYIRGGLTTMVTQPRSGTDTMWIDTLDAFGTWELKSIF
jgi:hypothetical protein